MTISPERRNVLRQLDAYLCGLGYSTRRPKRVGAVAPEIVRVSPTRGRIVYGEVVMRDDLRSKSCHERLVAFSQRRTRRRATILLFIGVSADDQPAVEELLRRLDIRSSTRGGHVHLVPVPEAPPRRGAAAARQA